MNETIFKYIISDLTYNYLVEKGDKLALHFEDYEDATKLYEQVREGSFRTKNLEIIKLPQRFCQFQLNSHLNFIDLGPPQNALFTSTGCPINRVLTMVGLSEKVI